MMEKIILILFSVLIFAPQEGIAKSYNNLRLIEEINIYVNDTHEPNNQIEEGVTIAKDSSYLDLCLTAFDQDWFEFEYGGQPYFIQVNNENNIKGDYDLMIRVVDGEIIVDIKSEIIVEVNLFLENEATLLSAKQGTWITIEYQTLYGLPDLVLQNIEHRSYAEIGDMIELKSRLVNKGKSLSAASKVSAYLVDGEKKDIQHLVEINVPLVLPDLWSPVIGIGALPNDIPEGKYFIKWIVDESNLLTESSKSNNIVYSTLIIKEYISCKADQYEPNNIEVNAVNIGKDFDIWTSQELCLVPGDKDYFNFTIGEDSYILLIHGYDELSQGSYGLQVSYNEVELFVKTFGVNEDNTDTYLRLYNSNEQLVSFNDDGNGYPYSSIRYELKEKLPDLVVEKAKVAPEDIYQDHEFILSCQIWNIGQTKAAASIVKYYLSRDSVLDNTDRVVGIDILNPIGHANYLPASALVKLPSTFEEGTYYVIISSDDNEDIEEINEQNNLAIIPFRVKRHKKADLTITSSTISTRLIDQADYAAISVVIENIGDELAPMGFVGYYLSMDEHLGEEDQLVHYGFHDPIDSGGSFILAKDAFLANKIGLGIQYLIIKADGFERIEEHREDNNTYIHQIEIIDTRRADLYIGGFYTAEEISEGNLPFSIEIYNSGDKKSDVTNYTIFYSTDDSYSDDDILLYEEDMPEIYPNSFFNSSGLLPINDTGEDFYLIVYVDESELIIEKDESNNHYVEQIGASGKNQGKSKYAQMPYKIDFETGSWDEYWEVKSSPYGRVRITSDQEPYDGTKHVILDSGKNGTYGLNKLDLFIDLTGASQVTMNFAWKDFGDETHDEDGIFLSNDGGVNFTKIYSFNPQNVSNNRWMDEVLYIDELAQKYNIQLTTTMVIRIQEYDNYSSKFDGLAFDNIGISSTKSKALSYLRSIIYEESNDPGSISIEVYPNPTTDFINIEGLLEGSSVVIFDQKGMKRLEYKCDDRARLELAGLNPGTYIIDVMNENQSIYKRKLLITK